ncbi:hypothetical protein GCM10009603_50710 [Nocardiopsis exhalans]
MPHSSPRIQTAKAAARGLQFTHLNAPRNLINFLNNSRGPQEQDVDHKLGVMSGALIE